MSEETKPVVDETVSGDTATGADQDSTNLDSLLHENKKYRKRSQDAETRLSELEKKLESAEEAKLKEKEDFKALYEKVSSDNDSLTKNADKWTKYEENRRTSLLESAPEEDREKLSTLDLDTLEYVTNKINNQKINAPEVVGQGRSVEPPKDIDWSDKQALKDNWDGIIQGYKKEAQSKQVKI